MIEENIPRNFNRLFFANSFFLIVLIRVLASIEDAGSAREKLEQLATFVPLIVVTAFIFVTLSFKIPERLILLLDFTIGLIVFLEILVFIAMQRSYADIPKAWSGFGRTYALVLIVALVVSFSLPVFLSKHIFDAKRYLRVKQVIGPLCIFIAGLYVPSLIQVPNGFTNFGDSTYFVLEESLAQTVGFIPYVNFTPIYTSSFGWLIAIVSKFGFNDSQLFWLVTVLINVLIAWCVIKTALILKRITPTVPFGSIFLAICSILLISGSNRGEYAMTSGLATIPARLFFPIAIFHFLNKSIDLGTGKKAAIQLGIVVAFGIIEPPGISLVAGIVALFILFLLSLKSRYVRRQLLYVLASAIGTLTTYVVILGCFFGRFDITRYLFMINAVSNSENSGTYQTNMPILGFHVVVFGCLTSCVFVGFRTLIRSFRIPQSEFYDKYIPRSLCASFFGLLGLVWSIQFSRASIYPFVLQFLLFWTMLAMWGLISLTDKGGWLTFLLNPRKNFSQVSFLSLAILIAVPVLSIAQMPNPFNEVRRIYGNESSEYDRWTESDLRSNPRGREIQEVLSRYSNESKGYFGILGNSTEVVFGIENYLGISSHESLGINSAGRDLGCAPLLKEQPEILIVAWTDFPCGGYVLIEDDPVSGVKVFRRG